MLAVSVLKSIIDVAMKRKPADLVIRGGFVLDVFCGKIERKDVAIVEGYIAALGYNYEAKEYIDLKGEFVLPGFIDAHIHIESSMLHPAEFAKAVLPHGTTAVVCDPHEIANVAGNEGIEYMLKETHNLPVDFFFTVPSCVPAAKGLETSGAELKTEDIAEWLSHPRFVGLAEVMNFPGVINGDEDLLEKIYIARSLGKKIDGHAPNLMGDALCAYSATGISSDHECTHLQEAEDKLKRGLYIMIREGSTAKNMKALIPLVRAYGVSRFMLVSDDRHPDDLYDEGHIDFLLKKAVNLGLAPNLAVRMVTFNPSLYFNLRRRGAIAPGYIADIVIVNNTQEFFPLFVLKRGKIVSERLQLKINLEGIKPSPFPTFNVKTLDFNFKVKAKSKKIRVIGIIPNQILTEHLIEEAEIVDDTVVSNTDKDILKIAVIERHKSTGNIGIGFIKGLGIKEGAIASSVAHDSHNIVVAGTNDDDMKIAALRIIELKGGMVIAKGGNIIAELALPIGGLMSDRDAVEVSARVKELKSAAKGIGAKIENPFMALSFMALPVIPKLKITDMGLVDVEKFTFVDLFV